MKIPKKRYFKNDEEAYNFQLELARRKISSELYTVIIWTE